MPVVNFADVNWLAVGASGVAAFMVGGVWYGALFGKAWQRAHGYTEEQVAVMKGKRSPGKFFGGMIASYMVMSAAMAVIITHLGVETIAGGAMLGAVVWAAAASLYMTNLIATQKGMLLFAIDAGCYLGALVVSGVILTAWR